jgi:septum formation protein
MKLVLASGSPRRRMLLEAAGYVIAEVCPADLSEIRKEGEDPATYTARLSLEKALQRVTDGAWTLGADTVVHWQEMVLEKPHDDAEARTMIRMLAGRWHQVTTGWCLVRSSGSPEPRIHTGQSTSRVRFRSLLDAEIAAYVATGEGKDKAGSYGIQGLGATLVAEVRGSYSNVVGLPMETLSALLQSLGIHPNAPETRS